MLCEPTTRLYAYGNDGCVKTVNDRGTFVFEHYVDGQYGCVIFFEGALSKLPFKLNLVRKVVEFLNA